MQMKPLCYTKRSLVISFCLMLSACVHQNPPISGMSIDAQQNSAQAAPEKSAVQGVVPSNASDNLSTKTVAPVGYERFFGLFTPYRITVQQGNFVSEEMAAQLKIGMTREQVRFILGTALLTDMFHADRWDYIFRLLKPSGELTTSRVTVHFEKSLVAKIERGALPDEKEYLKRITNAAIGESIEHAGDKTETPH